MVDKPSVARQPVQNNNDVLSTTSEKLERTFRVSRLPGLVFKPNRAVRRLYIVAVDRLADGVIDSSWCSPVVPTVAGAARLYCPVE